MIYYKMNKKELQKYVKNKRGFGQTQWKKFLSKSEYDKIIKHTSFLPKNTDWTTILFYFQENLKLELRCDICNNVLEIRNRNKPAPIYCSIACKNSKKAKAIESEKIKKTKLKRYGSSTYTNPEKAKQTNLERYGVENVAQSEIIKARMKQTNLERYGVENPWQSEEVKMKIKQTNIELYNKSCYLHSQDYLNKMKNIYNEQYGVDWYSSSDDFKNKYHKTIQTKYDCSHYFQSNEFLIKQRTNKWESFLQGLISVNLIPLFTEDEYLEIKSEYQYQCILCNEIITSASVNKYKIKCPNHNRTRTQSKYETEIEFWLTSLGISSIMNERFTFNKKNLELDVWIPDFRIGIEFHGLYWHSNTYKHSNYHLNKYEHFKNLDINVIQIFESDWIHNRNWVKSFIRGLLNLNENVLGTSIEKISFNVAQDFINDNYQHMLADNNYTGIFLNTELVSIHHLNENIVDLSIDKLNVHVTNSYKLICQESNCFLKIDNRFVDKQQLEPLTEILDVNPVPYLIDMKEKTITKSETLTDDDMFIFDAGHKIYKI